MRKLMAVAAATVLFGCGGISQEAHRKALDNQKQALTAQSDARAAELQKQIDALRAEQVALQQQLATAKGDSEKAGSVAGLESRISSYQRAVTAAARAVDDGLNALRKKDSKTAEAKFSEAQSALNSVR